MRSEKINQNVYPGVHSFALKEIEKHFSQYQKRVFEVFKASWYVSKADAIRLGNSCYEYMLIKAPEHLAELLGVYAEIIVVFSDYENFEPRTFDAYDYIKNKLELGRVENLCSVLLSKDQNVEEKVEKFTSGKETRIIIPFSYKEIVENKGDSYLISNKFKKHFFHRDLFAYEDALKTDLFFFGRTELVLNLIDDHFAGKNSGLFGLRKAGKTSILYDIQRKIQMKSVAAIIISCQNPGMSAGTWVDSIYFIVKSIYEYFNYDRTNLIINNFSELTAVDELSKIIIKVYEETKKTILLMLDEIEHITYKKATAEIWKNGIESIKFWKAMRATYLDLDNKFTFCIVGTNPICIEYSTIEKSDNPIFSGVKVYYIPGFDVAQTRSMVRKLGRIMGIKFDEILYAKFVEDYGGHPFLIRHLCSFIANKYKNRPVEIDRKKYTESKDEFNKTQGKYFEMLLDVLHDFYSLEYEMLKYLAAGDEETFNYFADADASMVQHLIGYGIVKHTDDYYDFQMDVIKNYICQREQLSKKFITKEERWTHLCTERGNLEIELRKMVKQILLLGVYKGKPNEAKDYVVNKLYGDSKRKYATYTYDDLFNPNKSEIYLSGLTKLIKLNWDMFSEFMKGMRQEDFTGYMNIINNEGRFDAHAKIPEENDIILFDATIKKLLPIIEQYRSFVR